MSSNEPGIAAAIERQRKEQESWHQQIMDMIRRMLDFATGKSRIRADPAEVQQNIQGLSDLENNLAQYRDQALQGGDIQRAYMAENMLLAVSAIRDGAHQITSNKGTREAVADMAMENLRESISSLQDDNSFAEAFSRYDLNSAEHLESSARSFNQDLVGMIGKSTFGTQKAQTILTTLGSRMNKVATHRLQAKPLTPAQKNGLAQDPGIGILDEYSLHGDKLEKDPRDLAKNRDQEPEFSR